MTPEEIEVIITRTGRPPVRVTPITRREPPSAGPVAQPLPPKPRPPTPAMAELDFRHDLDDSK